MTVYLSLDDLIALVRDLEVGPMRDLGLLDAATHRPAASHFGVELYSGMDVKAAVLMESIVRNHPLVDGNKRLGWLAVVVFYGLNDIELDAPDDDAYDLVVSMAAGEASPRETADALAKWHV